MIGALREMHVAVGHPEAVVGLLERSRTKVVTITVTEKGYCRDARTGGLDATHPDIVHDLAQRASPRSLVGVLHAACARRRAGNAGPLTVLSCDNLPANGRLLRRLVLEFDALAGGDAAPWVRDNVTFPSTMVDRIVPATTEDDIAAAAADTRVFDAALVCTEPFTQWVIEDRFAGERPAWDTVGALLVGDVEAYETAKLLLLNGAHSAIAYLGYLSGHTYVHEAMQDPLLAGFVEHLMRNEISPVTPAPAGMEHASYIPALLERFRNPALMHRTWQIAMDGSQKLPQRLLAAIRQQLAQGGRIEALSLGVAAWIRYTLGRDEHGAPIDVRDPLAAQFAAIASQSGSEPERLTDAYLALPSVFGEDLRAEPRLRGALVAHLESLLERGASATLRACLSATGGT
jgi:fructuronate reductase